MKIEIKEKVQKRARKPQTKWTPNDYKKYLIYIGAQKFKMTQTTVEPATFKEMAEFIGSSDKTEYECYTLHDRMKQKYKTFDNIVEKLKEIYNVK